MIAAIKTKESATTPAWHAGFLEMLPSIRRYAQITFRKIRPELRQELIAEVIANSLAAYARLVERGKVNVAFPSALARFSVNQCRAGRRLGSRLRVSDVMSPYAQYKKQFFVERLDQFNTEENCWQEIVVEDKTLTPADVAITRIDFADWLGSMPALRRKVAQYLATGETTFAAAKRFAVSAARISQIRREFQASWQVFHGEPLATAAAAA
jgi:hypothetical protein